jgi:predicted DCC family thiol-disulfide oxidoreductase YuxK
LKDHQVILFDGVCNFCNYWVNFILARDKNDLFRFAALQSEAGQMLLLNHGLENTDFDTFILIDGENYFTKSTAALMIAGKLKSVVKLFYPFIFLPKPIRDFFYHLIAKNRYKFFGKRDVCRIPTEEERGKFLD